MKSITLLFFVGSFATISIGQTINESKVPEAVKKAMKKNYASVKEIKWEKEDGMYEAGFEVNKVKNSVLLDAEGNVKETEHEISITDLPKAVSEYVKKNHPKSKIISAAKITDSKGVVKFEAEIKGKDLFFDSNGKFIK